MNTKEYRKEYQNDRANTDKLLDLDFIGCYKKESGTIIKKGFIELTHGDKENIRNFIESQVKIAEDGQAIYEFLQNAVDANSTSFAVFYNEDSFLVLNNGKKFDFANVKSILNFSQSTKTNEEQQIGKFGVGFKLIHRLVGEDSGIDEIIDEYKGPILFSWDNYYIHDLLQNDFSKIDQHWLFKIIYTNFPCGVNEVIKNIEYEDIRPFTQNDLNEMINFIKNNHMDFNKFESGSLFYLKLGLNKEKVLKQEEEDLKVGISTSLNILNYLRRNKYGIDDIVLNTCKITKDKLRLLSNQEYVFLYPALDIAEEYYKNNNKNVSFYKFFPMGDQTNRLNFILHHFEFEVETNRRKLQKDGSINKKILQKIWTDLKIKIDNLKVSDTEEFTIVIANLYLSDLLSANNQDLLIIENLTNYMLDYIKNNIPYTRTSAYGIETFETTNDKSRVVIVDSQLKNIPLKKKHHFYFNPKKYKVIAKEAVSKLGIIRWNIIQALVYDDISKWILELDDQQFNILLQEIAENKGNHSQNIVDIWDATYSLKEIEKILKIFELLNKDDIAFAVIKLEKDQYQIIPNSKNHYIKNIQFREFLEQEYELSKMNIYLIPAEIENELLEIIGKTTSDKKILIDLLRSGEHIELIDFIEEYNVEEIFLDTLEVLDIDTSLSYTEKSFQSKVLGLALKFEYFEIRERILFNNEPLASSLKSRYINFKHGRVISPFNYDNQVPNEIQKYIDSLDQTLQSLFKIEEDSKEDVFENILETVRNRVLNTYNRLLFVVLYSLELEQNLLKKFNGVEIKKDIDSGFTSLNKILLVDIKGIKLDSVVEKTNFSIIDFFPNSLQKDYYILDDEYLTENEKLPSGLKQEYLETFKVLGLCIDSVLPELRKKILSGEDIKRDDLVSFTDTQLINTLEFLSFQNKVYDFDNADTINIKTIFKQLKSSTIDTLEFLPILKTKSSFVLQRLHKYLPKEYITKESIKSSNQAFQERIEKEIEQKSLIYLDILDLDESDIRWKKVTENEDEKVTSKLENLKRQEQEFISATTANDDKDISQQNWLIGWRGEKYVYELLVNKFGIDNVVWHNESSTSYQDDKGGIDFEVLDENSNKLNIEVKTTTGSIYTDSKIQFTLSSKQFEAARSWGRNTHLIFVSGIDDKDPELLYMNFDNNWLQQKKDYFKQSILHNKLESIWK